MEIGPTEFCHLTGLSPKALRLYEERGLLQPRSVDPGSRYRRYGEAEVTRAGRIALLRRAGISLGEIARFLDAPEEPTIEDWLRGIDDERDQRRAAVLALARSLELKSTRKEEAKMPVTIRPIASADELLDAFDVAGAPFRPVIDRSDERRLSDLRREFDDHGTDLLLVAEDDDRLVGAALGFLNDTRGATLRILGLQPDYQGQGIGRALLRSFERAVERRGGSSVSLGADESVGFYVRHGYQTMFLLQWAYDATNYEHERSLLLAGVFSGMEFSDDSFSGVPQLFVILDEPNPAVRAQASDVALGAHVGYCMTKRVGTPTHV